MFAIAGMSDLFDSAFQINDFFKYWVTKDV